MKKLLLSGLILVTIIVLVNIATAVPYIQIKTLEDNKIDDIKIREFRFSPLDKLKGLIYVLIGFFGIVETALLIIIAYIFAGVFHLSQEAIVFLVLAVITGIPSIAFLVAGTVLIFQ